MIRLLLAIALAASSLAMPSLAQERPKEPDLLVGEDWLAVRDWVRANVESEQFEDIATLNLSAVVWSDAETMVRAGSNVQVWEHIEFFNREAVEMMNGVRSMLVLREYRCTTRQERQLAGSTYKGTDLSGTPIDFDQSRPSAWRYVQPNQLDDALMSAACNGIRFFDGEN